MLRWLINRIPESIRNVRYAYLNERIKKKELKRNEVRVKEMLAKGNPIRLELGAGGRKVEGYYSVDRYDPAALLVDFTVDTLPLPDETVDEVYTCHFLEHVRYPKPMKDILTDVYRVLKKGGRINVVVPDARQYIDAYLHPEKYPDPKEICVWEPAYFHHSPIDFINYIAYLDEGEHKILFEPENIKGILEETGFIDVEFRDPDPKLDPDYHVNAKYDSIYLYAWKK